MLNIKMLKASCGDSIIITYGKEMSNYILIDGGIGRECYRQLVKFSKKIVEEKSKINLLILTHTDSDHISGILKLFTSREFDFNIVNEMWFNYGTFLNKALDRDIRNDKNVIYLQDEGCEISWKQGNRLENVLKNENILLETVIKKLDKYNIEGAYITILSPSIEVLKEFNENWEMENDKVAEISAEYDYSEDIEMLNAKAFVGNITLANKSSIAFLFEYESMKILFLGDAAPDEVVNSLQELGYSEDRPLYVDFCKISHHASKHNTNNKLIKLIQCQNFLISTNQTTSGRPSKECLSRIICNSDSSVKFYCNYDLKMDNIFSAEEIKKYDIQFITLDEQGVEVEELYNAR